MGAAPAAAPLIGRQQKGSTLSIRFGYADTELGQVHYRESGVGPPVVLLHESPLSGRIYEATLPYLGQRVRAIAPDTPGYGASEPPPEGIDIEGYAERLLLFLDAMQLDQVALVGNHTGGSIGIELAIRYPRRVSGLVVVGSAVFDEEEGRSWIASHIESFPFARDGSHLEWLWTRYQRIWGEDSPTALLHQATTEFLRTAERYEWGYVAAFNYRAAERLPLVGCPVLFLTSAGDMLVDKQDASIAITPDARGELFSSPWGQMPARHPEEFSDSISLFLEDIGYL